MFNPPPNDTAVQLAYLAEALAQQPEIVDQRFIDREVRQIVGGTQYDIKCVRDLMEMWKPELTKLSTRRPSDKEACAQLFLDLEACTYKAVVPPKSKVMLYVTPWLYKHRWECSNPRLVWEGQSPSLSLKFKDMKYFDDVEDEVAKRKEGLIEELRQILFSVKIARTGYMYIFDSKMNMIIFTIKNIKTIILKKE